MSINVKGLGLVLKLARRHIDSPPQARTPPHHHHHHIASCSSAAAAPHPRQDPAASPLSSPRLASPLPSGSSQPRAPDLVREGRPRRLGGGGRLVVLIMISRLVALLGRPDDRTT
jgi:hypothetical protein